MGEVVSAVVKELSCHDCARYVCNDASVHSRCCDSEECCECDVETRPVKPPEEELELEVRRRLVLLHARQQEIDFCTESNSGDSASWHCALPLAVVKKCNK